MSHPGDKKHVPQYYPGAVGAPHGYPGFAPPHPHPHSMEHGAYPTPEYVPGTEYAYYGHAHSHAGVGAAGYGVPGVHPPDGHSEARRFHARESASKKPSEDSRASRKSSASKAKKTSEVHHSHYRSSEFNAALVLHDGVLFPLSDVEETPLKPSRVLGDVTMGSPTHSIASEGSVPQLSASLSHTAEFALDPPDPLSFYTGSATSSSTLSAACPEFVPTGYGSTGLLSPSSEDLSLPAIDEDSDNFHGDDGVIDDAEEDDKLRKEEVFIKNFHDRMFERETIVSLRKEIIRILVRFEKPRLASLTSDSPGSSLANSDGLPTSSAASPSLSPTLPSPMLSVEPVIDGKLAATGLTEHLKGFGRVAKAYFAIKLHECHDDKSANEEIVELKQRYEEMQNDIQRFSIAYTELMADPTLEPKEKKDDTYPSDDVLIVNHLQAIMEDIFSSYHLKQNKRLLQELERPPHGFMSLSQIAAVKRVRSVVSDKNAKEYILKAAQASAFLLVKQAYEFPETALDGFAEESISPMSSVASMEDTVLEYKDENEHFIGPIELIIPQEKEWPMRQTMFVIGLPCEPLKAEKMVRELIEPFGELKKLQLDDGPDSRDALFGQQLLQSKMRVHTLYRDFGATAKPHDAMRWITDKRAIEKELDKRWGLTPLIDPEPTSDCVTCSICRKTKHFADGIFLSGDLQDAWCRKCAKERADEQLNEWRTTPRRLQTRKERERLLGRVPEYRLPRTALVVMKTQRQAANCTTVRARIAMDGVSVVKYVDYVKHMRPAPVPYDDAAHSGMHSGHHSGAFSPRSEGSSAWSTPEGYRR